MKIIRSERFFNRMVNIILSVLGILALYPLIYVLMASISDPTAVNSGKIILWPVGFNIDGYRAILKNRWVLIGYRNSLFYTVAGTILNVVVTVMTGYALSRQDLYGKRLITLFMMFTMWFNGGIITTYLVVHAVGLYNRWYTLLVVGLISVYNTIIARSFISGSIPGELMESAKMDGCSDLGILGRVVVPLSKPLIAILSLYYGLSHWNSYFSSLIYLKDKNKQTLQIFLREILIQNETIQMNSDSLDTMIQRALMAQTMKYSLIVVASLPMLILYPFLQKFFVKGVMIGSVKG